MARSTWNSSSISIARVARIRCQAVVVELLALAIGIAGLTSAQAQSPSDFANLTSGQRVYDETGMSLTAEQTDSLNSRIASLDQLGANVVVYVRALDATPDETLAQVEALQNQWAVVSGGSQDTAVAFLINRNPNDPNDARAGIFVGNTYDDGNVPPDEQRAIVDEELIPPLRNGDVYASLSGGLARLESSIVNGPPQSGFERWAASASESWLTWVGLGLAALGAGAAALIFRTRQHGRLPAQPPSTVRPGDLSPALAGTLVAGSPQASAIPATLLSLAERGAIAFEPESEGGVLTQPKIQVRLQDQGQVNGEVEVVLWNQLDQQAEDGVVSSKGLQKIAADFGPIRDVLNAQIQAAGWNNPQAGRNHLLLGVVAVIAALLAIASFVITAVGGNWISIISAIALVALSIAAIVLYSMYSSFSPAGQDAAKPWLAYRDGLKAAAKNDAASLDLDLTLPDAIAMNLGSNVEKRVKNYQESGQTLRAFSGTPGMAVFPYWVAFNSSVTTTSGSSSSTVSSSGSSGGGAAGST